MSTPADSPSCGHVAAVRDRCRCGHIAEFHDLARDRVTRKACSIHTGRRGVPCGCERFEPEVP